MSDPLKAYIRALIEQSNPHVNLTDEQLEQFKAFCENSDDISPLAAQLKANVEDLWQAYEIRRPEPNSSSAFESNLAIDEETSADQEIPTESSSDEAPEIQEEPIVNDESDDAHINESEESHEFEEGSALAQLSASLGQNGAPASAPEGEQETEDEVDDTEEADTLTEESVPAETPENLTIEEDETPFTDKSEITPALSMDPANANRKLNEFDMKIQEELNQPIQQRQINEARFNLTNAKVGKSYEFHLDVAAHTFGVYDVQLEGLEDLGLSFDTETNMIAGTPTTPGDVSIKLNYRIEGEDNDGEFYSRDIPLIINPDPRSLWKNIDPPADAPYPKTNSEAESLKCSATRLVSASARGRSHAHEGTHRDDDYGMRYLTDSGWHLMTVADGAGSAKYSRKGSEIACDTAMTELSKLNDIDAELEQLIRTYISNPSDSAKQPITKALYSKLGNAALSAYNNIKAEADEQDEPIKVYGTTLLMGCAKKFDFGWFVCALWIGDGAIAIYQSGADPILLGKPDGGEFAGQTRFLTMADIFQDDDLYDRVRFDIVEDFTALILMTDGVSDPKFQTDHNLEQASQWDALWQDMAETVNFDLENENVGNELLDWLDFWSPGNHDDRTISILY